jgi:hypothetical protein
MTPRGQFREYTAEHQPEGNTLPGHCPISHESVVSAWPGLVEAWRSKLFASETAVYGADEAIQILNDNVSVRE